MSILLEALRKSEKSQRSREVPTIHTEVPSSGASRSLKSGLGVVLLVLTLVVCGWFVWNQYRAPSDIEQSATAGPVQSDISARPADTGATQSPSVKLPVLDGTNRKEVALDSPVISGGGTRNNTVNETGSDNQTVGRRTPMESYQAAENEKENEAKSAGMTVASKTPRQMSTGDRSTPGSVKKFGAKTDVTDSGTKAEEPYRPGAPAVLGYWDLPDSVRADVPEITFSVLVYDRNPENRFVLINGERLAEGDAHQPGLLVKEIRRDGVIFSYRLYQFLIEK